MPHQSNLLLPDLPLHCGFYLSPPRALIASDLYLDSLHFSSSHQLENGWWVYVNLSADAIKQLCSNIIEAIGIPEEECDVELW